MPGFRYSQFCPLARAAEVIGDRWTLPVVRELFLGPQRFSDLMRRIPGVSSSVLSARIRHLEQRGVVSRTKLPPPAASHVIALTELGQALRPVMLALTTWGIRLMEPPRPGDHFEPSWIRLGLSVIANPNPMSDRKIAVHVPDGETEFTLYLTAGDAGVRLDVVDPDPGRHVDAELRGPGMTLLGIAAFGVDARAAHHDGEIEVTGDEGVLDELSAFFSLDAALSAGLQSTAPATTA